MDPKQKGWCKLYKQITESTIFENKDHFALFVWLLVHAAFVLHNEKVGRKQTLIQVYPGEIYTNREEIAECNGISLSSVDRYLIALEKDYDTLIIKEKYDYSTIKIKITNWKKYQ